MSSLVTTWSTSLPSSGYTIVNTVVVQNNVYAGSNGYVYKLDPVTGAVLATNTLKGLGNHEVRLAVSSDGSFLLVGINGLTLSLNPNNLSTIWQTSLPGSGNAVTSVLCAGGSAYAGSNGHVYRLNPTNGSVLYHNGLPERGEHEVRLAMTLANDMLLVGTYGFAIGLSPSDIATKWQTSLPGSGYGNTSIAGGNGCGYSACNGFLFRLASNNGSVTHTNGLAGTGKNEVHLALKGDGTFLFVGTNGYGISVDANTLTTIYSLALPGSGFSITDVVSGLNTAFFANNGYVFQLDVAGNVVTKNELPESGELETRLAVLPTADHRVVAGINGYAIGLLDVPPQPKGPWMSAMASTIGPRKLREISIPGESSVSLAPRTRL